MGLVMPSKLNTSYPIGFAVGTGRCGTKCLAELMGSVEGVSSHHEINPLNETFHRFSKWYDLPIDDAGFVFQKQAEIAAEMATSKSFFEASAYLTLSMKALHEAFNCRFVLMVRHPEDVANSYKRKGWYQEAVKSSDDAKIPGFQPSKQFHHYLGRTLPKNMPFDDWNRLTTIGKLGWYWAEINSLALTIFKELPNDCWRVQKLEALDFDAFCDVADFLGAPQTPDPAIFEEITNKRPNSFDNLPKTQDWSEQDRQQFVSFVGPTADEFGYEIGHLEK